MNTLKSKIITLRYAKILFYAIFIIGTICFLLTTIGSDENVIRNGLISIVLMLFGYIAAEVCNYYIRLLLAEFKNQKSKPKRVPNKKIIEFNKIA